jgi:NAD(P)-dependent dehydrogenase (short-subunit alcohol dehydrogenase family)
MTELNGTVAVVTGAGRGIGREIALHQAQAGAKVGILAGTAREIDETASLITGAGGAAIAIPVDLVDRLAVEDALARVAGNPRETCAPS